MRSLLWGLASLIGLSAIAFAGAVYQFDYLFAARLKALLDGYPGAGLWAVHPVNHCRIRNSSNAFVACSNKLV